MFETVSKDNLPSLYSDQRVLETRVLKEFDNGDLYIEDLRKIDQYGVGELALGVVLLTHEGWDSL